MNRQAAWPISTNFAWAVSDKATRFVVGSLLTIWIARHLGPQAFGALSFALAMVTLCTVFANPGLDAIVVRDLTHQPAKQQAETLHSALLVRLIGSALAMSGSWLLTLALQPEGSNAATLSIVLAMGLFAQSFDVYELWFQSKLQTRFVVVAKSAPFILGALARIVLIGLDAPVIAFATVQTAEFVFGALFLRLVFGRHRLAERHTTGATRVRELLAASWPLAAASAAVGLYMRLDQVLLAQFFDQRVVGIYNAAVRLSEMWYLAPLTLLATLLPITVRMKLGRPDEYLHLLRRLYCLSMYVGLSGALVIYFFAAAFVPLLLGEEFIGSIAPLRILGWSAIPILIGVATSQYLVAENLQRISLYRTLLGLVANIALNFILIPRFGAQGAALAATLGYVVPIFALGMFRSTRGQLALLVSALNPMALLPMRKDSSHTDIGTEQRYP